MQSSRACRCAPLKRFPLWCRGSRRVSEAFAASEPSAAHKGRRYIKTGTALTTFMFTAALAGFLASPLFAQTPSIEWKVDALVVEPGESVDSQLILTNTAAPNAPEAKVPDGVKLQLLNPSPSTMSQTSIVNNQMTQTTTYTFVLRLTGVKEGVHTVGPVAVNAGGKTYTAAPITLTVRKSAAAKEHRGDQFVFVTVDAEPTTLYVSQSYRATLTIGIRKVVINGRRVEMNLLGIVDGSASELSIFPRSGWTSSQTVLADSAGRRNEYEVFRVSTSVQANEIGTISVGPVFVRANYPLAVRRGFFGEEVTRSRHESARAEAVLVKVKAPALESRPEDFSGAIGRFEMKVDAQPRRVEQGQPVTLTIAFRGAPLGGIAPPDLRRASELAGRFDYTQEELVGDMDGEWKVFRRAIFPKQAGAQTVPAISWSYFDTQTEKYVTLTSEAIAIIVDAPKSGGEPSLSFDLAASSEPENELTVLTGGLSPNYVDPDRVLVNQAFVPTSAHAVVAGALPIAYLAVFLGVRRRERLRADAGGTRRRGALRAAQAQVHGAARLRNPEEHMRALAQSIGSYVSDRFGMSAQALTPAEVRAELANRGVDGDLIQTVFVFLEQVDALRYAGDVSAASIAGAAQRVREWLTALERQS